MAKAAGPRVIFIVDDDDAVRDGFARLLRAAGLDARAYGSPEKFLEDVSDIPGACVLLDITMPSMTGTEVQKRLAGLRGCNAGLPVITISARDDGEIRGWARGMGARMFLRKPVDDRALFDAINWVTGGNYGR